MAKIKKRNLDSVKRAPVSKQTYESPSINLGRRDVPKEYQTFQKARKGKGSALWFVFLLFIATIAGFWFFSKYSQEKDNASVKLDISGPEKIVSGDQVTYQIVYKNIDIVPMQQLELSVRWPSGFYFDTATVSPIDENATTWLLEDLPAGQEVKMEISGQLVGQKDEELSAGFTLAYQPENFHSDFTAKADVVTKITDAKIELAVQAVDKTLVSTAQEIKVDFKNLSTEDLNDLYIDILYPDDFVIGQPDATSDEILDNEKEVTEEIATTTADFISEGDYLKLNLQSGQTKTMLINGFFTLDAKTDQLLVVEIGNMVNDKFRRLARVEKPILAINPQFEMNFQINGQNGSQAINWSDTLRYQLEITNRSESEVNDVAVLAVVDSTALDWDSLNTVGKYEDGKITWTKAEDERLAKWPAGESRIFTWQVDIVDDPQPERTVENIIKINIEGLNDWQQVSSAVLLNIGESISFNNGVYWDLGGRRVGSGLLPPQVGEATDYLVIWSLPQATGVFDSVTISTNLPPQVDFVSELDVQDGVLEFDLGERSLTWTMDEFNNSILPLTASFMVRLTPDEASRGQVMTILNASTVSASGKEAVVVRSKAIKTSDVISDSGSPIGIVE